MDVVLVLVLVLLVLLLRLSLLGDDQEFPAKVLLPVSPPPLIHIGTVKPAAPSGGGISPDSTRLKKSSTEVFRGIKLEDSMELPNDAVDVTGVIELGAEDPPPVVPSIDDVIPMIAGKPMDELGRAELFTLPVVSDRGIPSAKLCRFSKESQEPILAQEDVFFMPSAPPTPFTASVPTDKPEPLAPALAVPPAAVPAAAAPVGRNGVAGPNPSTAKLAIPCKCGKSSKDNASSEAVRPNPSPNPKPSPDAAPTLLLLLLLLPGTRDRPVPESTLPRGV